MQPSNELFGRGGDTDTVISVALESLFLSFFEISQPVLEEYAFYLFPHLST